MQIIYRRDGSRGPFRYRLRYESVADGVGLRWPGLRYAMSIRALEQVCTVRVLGECGHTAVWMMVEVYVRTTVFVCLLQYFA